MGCLKFELYVTTEDGEDCGRLEGSILDILGVGAAYSPGRMWSARGVKTQGRPRTSPEAQIGRKARRNTR